MIWAIIWIIITGIVVWGLVENMLKEQERRRRLEELVQREEEAWDIWTSAYE